MQDNVDNADMDNTRTDNPVNEPPGELPGDDAIYEILCRISDAWRRQDGLPGVTDSPQPRSDFPAAPATPADDESAETIIIRPQKPVESQKTAPEADAEDLEKTVIINGPPVQNRDNNTAPPDMEKKAAIENGDTGAPPSWDDDGETLIIQQTDPESPLDQMDQDETLIIHQGPEMTTDMTTPPQKREDDDIVTETIVLGPGSYDRI